MDKLGKALKERFLGYFSDLGSREIEPEPLIPKIDQSVFFTNAITTRVKPYFLESAVPLPKQGVHLVQPCLRFHNLNRALDESFDPEYMTYFEMIGGAVPPDQMASIKRNCTRFFAEAAGISPDRLKVLCSSRDQEFLSDYGHPIPVDVDTKPPKYYSWNYGTDDLTGRGMTFAVRHANGMYQDIGNIIAVERENRLVGYEYGFGVECIVSRAHSLSSIFDATVMAGKIPTPSTSIERKYADALLGIAVVSSTGIQPDASKQGRMYQKLLRNLCFLADEAGIDDAKIADDLSNVSLETLGINTHVPGCLTHIRRTMGNQRAMISQFGSFVREQAGAMSLERPSSRDAAISLCLEKSENPKVPNFLRDRIIRSHFGEPNVGQ